MDLKSIMRCNFCKPDSCFDSFRLAKWQAHALKQIAAPMLEQQAVSGVTCHWSGVDLSSRVATNSIGALVRISMRCASFGDAVTLCCPSRSTALSKVGGQLGREGVEDNAKWNKTPPCDSICLGDNGSTKSWICYWLAGVTVEMNSQSRWLPPASLSSPASRWR